MEYQELMSCVACGSTNLQRVLDLGAQPLANEYRDSSSVLKSYPLGLNTCTSCFHSQNTVSVNAEILFKEYSYVSGTSLTLARYFESFKNEIIANHGPTGKLLDIGSNDGSFLSTFKNSGWSVIGVDPAANLVVESVARGVTTIPAFFDQKLAKFLSSNFDVVVAMNVFAHTSDPLEILLGIRELLSENGTAYIQTSQANMFENSEFDTIYHEHISFFSVRSMKALVKRAGMFLNDVDIVPVHGNSYIWKVSLKDKLAAGVQSREDYEEALEFYEKDFYKKYARESLTIAEKISEKINEFRGQGYKIASYGAAAKGNTFLNFARIKLDYIFDDTPQKIGKIAPAGGNCRVLHSSGIAELSSKTLIIIPAWNFREEIKQNISTAITRSDCFTLLYYPELEVSLIRPSINPNAQSQ